MTAVSPCVMMGRMDTTSDLDEQTWHDAVDAGLRVAQLGRSSVRYEIGLFREGAETPAAEGWFVHVFVDRGTRRPHAIPDALRAAMERLQRPQPELLP